MLNKAIKKAKENKKGFTLAELLIVVAIIAVLVAISIPIFTSQLEKSREAVDLANIRAAYAECMTAHLTDDAVGYFKKVDPEQKTSGWTIDASDVGGKNISRTGIVSGTPCYVKVSTSGDFTLETSAPTASNTLKEIN